MEFTKHTAAVYITTPDLNTGVPALVEYYYFPRNIYGWPHIRQVGESNSCLWKLAVSFGIARETDLLNFEFDGVDTYTLRRVKSTVPYNDEQEFNFDQMDTLGTFRVVLL